MGVRKGTDNFKQHRQGKLDIKVAQLQEELDKAGRRKMPYPDLTTLVSDMSERVSLHRTTLTRNKTYMAMLLRHLNGQAGASALVVDSDASPELLRAKLLDAELELSQVRRELAKAQSARALASKTPAISSSAAYAAFSDTVWVLRQIVERVNADGELLVVDLKKSEVRDLAAAPGRQVVVSGSRVRSFADAYRLLLEQEGKL